MDRSAAGAPGIAVRDVVGSSLLGVGLAVAQPVLDLLARNAAFFTARQAPPLDVIALGVLLAVVLPVVVALPIGLFVRLAPRAGAGLHAVVLTLLVAAVVDQVADRSGIAAAVPVPVVALAVALLVVVVCLRVEAVRTLLRWGTVVPLAVLAMFLLLSPVRGLLAPGTAEASEHRIGTPAPVVIALFDQLPTWSISDDRGRVDASLYPGFARLTEDFTWYRNTATMYAFTHQVVPAMWSGSGVRPDTEPVAADYPDNLFTLLGGEYDIWAHEEVSWLCPPDLCDALDDEGVAERWRSLVSDTAVVAGHMVLPDRLTVDLPPIDEAWGGFRTAAGPPEAARAEAEEPPAATFDEFLATFGPDDGPVLRYFHEVRPHHPFFLLEDGRQYPTEEALPGLTRTAWTDHTFLRRQAQQRMFLQIGYVDGLVSRLLDTLEAWPGYDDALVIVLSDHGMAFTAGEPHRIGTVGNADETAWPILFVKPPGQRSGGVDDRPASLSDVLPTIVDVLEVRDVWPMEGRSLLGGPADADRERVFVGRDIVTLPPDRSAVERVVGRKLATFPAGRGWDGLYRWGPHGDLVGEPVARLATGDAEEAAVDLTDADRYEHVDLDADSLPAHVRGWIRTSALTPDSWVAVAVNGRVAATAQIHGWTRGGASFSAMAHPDAFVAGRNEVALLRIEPTPDGPVLHPLRGG